MWGALHPGHCGYPVRWIIIDGEVAWVGCLWTSVAGRGPRWLDRITSYSLGACYSMIGRAIRILLYHLKELDFYTSDLGIAHILEEYSHGMVNVRDT